MTSVDEGRKTEQERRAAISKSLGAQGSERKKRPVYGEVASSPRVAREVFVIDDTFRRGHMPRSPHWSVPWSDLMMTMFIFFVVLYVYQQAHKEFLSPEGLGGEGGSQLASRVMETAGRGLGEAAGPAEGFIEKMYDLSRQTLADEALQEFASVELVPDRTVRIILTGDLLFDSGEAALRMDARQSLAKIAQVLRQSQYAIDVVGHTDDVPVTSERFPSNWDLSASRASAVARYLIDEMKIPADQFQVTGYSFHRPRRPNTTPAGRAANRRVEIIISRENPVAMPAV
ncbi:OmpA/MotB family protein [Thiovibrio sp. JS02]